MEEQEITEQEWEDFEESCKFIKQQTPVSHGHQILEMDLQSFTGWVDTTTYQELLDDRQLTQSEIVREKSARLRKYFKDLFSMGSTVDKNYSVSLSDKLYTERFIKIFEKELDLLPKSLDINKDQINFKPGINKGNIAYEAFCSHMKRMLENKQLVLRK